MPVKDYSEEEIKRWVLEEPESKLLDENEVDHVVHCLSSMVNWYFDKIAPYNLDPFLVAVVRNDFMGACGEADNTNEKVLPLYCKFLYNNIPGDWREKAKKQFERFETGVGRRRK